MLLVKQQQPQNSPAFAWKEMVREKYMRVHSGTGSCHVTREREGVRLHNTCRERRPRIVVNSFNFKARGVFT